MEYLVDNKKFHFSYRELRETYHHLKNLTDDAFFDKKNLLEVIHFVCFVGYLKEMPASVLLPDNGLLHELIHLLQDVPMVSTSVRDIRNLFDKLMAL